MQDNFPDDVNTPSTTLRLIYPQWQGGVINHWLPDIPPNDACRGYMLGCQLLTLLAPPSRGPIAEVPISKDLSDRTPHKGISSYDIIVKQTAAALKIVEVHSPERIVTLGGECAVSVVPFTYLASRYPNDMAIVWIDAHPDITLPGDPWYDGWHAMAVTACMGTGDETLMKMLPAKVEASKILLVGVRQFACDEEAARVEELGLPNLPPARVRDDSSDVLKWLKESGVSKVAVHIDLDVLDPEELIAGVGVAEDGMKISEVARVVQDIAREYDLVGLSVAEPMPRWAIKIRSLLNNLPLI